MIKRIILFGALLISNCFFISGCSNKISSEQQFAQQIVTQKECYKQNSFSSLVLDGNASFEIIKSDNSQLAISITDMRSLLPEYNISINQKTLYLTTSQKTQNAIIKIYMPKIQNITTLNNANLTAKKLTSNKSIITAHQNSSINLEGNYNILKITQNSSGNINITWVNSPILFIDDNSPGRVTISGTANEVTAKLTNTAKLDAKYLRTKKTTIFTTDNAIAEVWTSDQLNAYAIDNSNIYYYKLIPHIIKVTKDHGNVLHPGWIA